jgi:uracil-DNA glycosylase family 4
MLAVNADLGFLDREMRSCTLCAEILAKHPVYPPNDNSPVLPRPIFSPPMQAPVMLIGQAPGPTEYRTSKPFSGQAGDGARALFAECGLPESDFDRLVYQTSAAKCFPGRRPNNGRWEDRPPCEPMLRNCAPFLERQIALVNPRVIVAMGRTAIKLMDRLRNIRSRSVSEVAGTVEFWGNIQIVHIAHTSGGSRFLNSPENRAKQDRAKAILRTEFSALRGLKKS